MKTFAVIGLGHFGENVARKLFAEGKEVIAIDLDKERVQDAAEFSSQAYLCGRYRTPDSRSNGAERG